MLEVKSLYSHYGSKEALHDVSFTAPSGSVTAIVGPNGCGKSTLLKAISGIQPATGQMLLAGEELLTMSRNRRAQKTAYLAQNRRTPDMTVRQLVLHGRFPYLGYPRRYRRADYAAAEQAIAQMGLMDLADVFLRQLSGGQLQRAYLAMALAQDTPMILLDEPTTYLDIAHQLQLISLVKQLTQGGKTVLMVIHDLPQAFSLADRLVVMDSGRIVGAGTPEEIFDGGIIDRVFGIQLCRIATETGVHYYCDSPMPSPIKAKYNNAQKVY